MGFFDLSPVSLKFIHSGVKQKLDQCQWLEKHSLSPKQPISGQLLQLHVPVKAGLTLKTDPKLSEWIKKTEFVCNDGEIAFHKR